MEEEERPYDCGGLDTDQKQAADEQTVSVTAVHFGKVCSAPSMEDAGLAIAMATSIQQWKAGQKQSTIEQRRRSLSQAQAASAGYCERPYSGIALTARRRISCACVKYHLMFWITFASCHWTDKHACDVHAEGWQLQSSPSLEGDVPLKSMLTFRSAMRSKKAD